MWIALKSSLAIMTEKGVAFTFHYNFFVHGAPQNPKAIWRGALLLLIE